MTPPADRERPDYGIDAPSVIRNLLIAAFLCLSFWGITTYGAVSRRFTVPQLVLGLAGMAFGTGICSLVVALWMLWDSKVGKLRRREQLLNYIQWTSNERVLDVGCGRGLLLIGAAKRLTNGKATGIDLWQKEDLSGNRPEATLENARREGVADRVDVQTEDMRRMSFADETFDLVVSRAAIHNLYDASDRAKAIREIARVMKPGAQGVIEDIRHASEYSRVFAENHCRVRDVSPVISRTLATLLTFGALRPTTLIVRKDVKRQ